MTASTEKLGKLLDLFPVEAIRDSFGLEGVKEKVVTDASAKGLAVVQRFAAKNFHVTRQHVYAFENPHEKVPAEAAGKLLEGHLVSNETKDGKVSQFYLANEVVRFLVEDEDADIGIQWKEAELFWPVQIQLTSKYMLLRCTILERDLSTLFPGVKILTAGKKQRDDSGLIKEAFKALNAHLPWDPLDLNTAVKQLWHDDEFDALRVRSKKSRSTIEEAMDEEFTLKKADRAEYDKIITRPLHQCTFLFLKNQDRYGRGFVCDATAGLLRFTRYCRDSESTDHVIDRILAANF